ncbi:MAG: aminotransferase class III-fold pyridoxal phosphate-dependent enzyme, partial [Lachnospiraceae bacterium]|nr:aminotransferase class III-fold pyridoxal phosphate-dependent enzyme [Lachnospiraceae bacterium]
MDYMGLGDKYFLHTYNRYPIVIERGEGVKLYDDKGREYLDFAAGIAVYALGYGNREFN